MGKVIAFHSYKGGTGKTLISANLAVVLAKEGSDVCILDYDFRAPSQHLLFKQSPNHWLDEFLLGKCSIADAIINLSDRSPGEGRLMAGFANPASDTMRLMMAMDDRWETKSLHGTLQAKEALIGDLRLDYVIFDTAPGMQLLSANALAVSDVNVVVTKTDEFDVEGTKELVRGVYKVLGRKVSMIANRVLEKEAYDETLREELRIRLEKRFGVPVIGVIPCYCDLQLHGGTMIHALTEQEHPFIDLIRSISKELVRIVSEGGGT